MKVDGYGRPLDADGKPIEPTADARKQARSKEAALQAGAPRTAATQPKSTETK